MRTLIENQRYDEERSLYALKDADVKNCVFAGPADGESVLKEARDVSLENCRFSLRYPLWHVEGFKLHDSSLDEATRAPIWYSRDGIITDSDLNCIKAVRECQNIKISDCNIASEEFGWKCDGITITDSTLKAQYVFLDSKNVTVYDSVVKGEYLAWFSEGLTLVNCKIIGTQPLCYCKNLTLVNCTMEGTDLAFEYSDVNADIKGSILSVKNPRSGHITADAVGEVIFGDAVMECTGEVHIR